MKRVGHLYDKLLSDDNLMLAIITVNATHRWRHYPNKPNPTTLWVEKTKDERVKDLRRLIDEGFVPSPCTPKRRFDSNARKWRDIYEPRLWPDQYVHHALIQVLEPVMMRGMDHWCCGSIQGRGAHYGVKALKKWMKNDTKGTRWCAELDIRHFYDSIRPEVVMRRMRKLIKDRRVLDLIERVTANGIQIGAYYSQWFANTLLQPLDHKIREGGYGVTHYVRYMDNFTIFAGSKKEIREVIRAVEGWLADNGLELKSNWQYFRVRAVMPVHAPDDKKMLRRYPNALGYRYGRDFTLLRKHSLMRLRRQLKSFYRMRAHKRHPTVKFCQGAISRLGMLRHCNADSIYRRYIRQKTQRDMKNIIRINAREAQNRWNTFLAQNSEAA